MLRGLVLLLFIYLFVFISDSKLKILPIAHAANSDNIFFPHVVYRASPNKPDKVFKYGFKRSALEASDLSQHIQANSEHQSVFISTTSSYQHALDLAKKFAVTWWDTDEFYIYEIIPQNNFIDVSAIFYSPYNARQRNRKSFLENNSTIFKIENEFAAMNYISPETIVLANRYFLSDNKFVNDDKLYINNITRKDIQNPMIEPEIFTGNFPLGNLSEIYYEFQGANPDFSCYNDSFSPESKDFYVNYLSNNEQFYHVKKRDVSENENKLTCPSKNLMQKKSYYINMPKDFLENKKTSFKFSTFNMPEICLVPQKSSLGSYIFLSVAKCSSSNLWSFTEYGQIITQVNDGYFNQYYCLRSPVFGSNDRNIRLEICDISVKEQKWVIEKFENKYYLKNYFNQTLLLGKNKFVLMSFDKISPDFLDKNQNVLYFLNAHEVLNSTTEAFVQFSMDLLYTEDFYVMYPSAGGNAFQDYARKLLKYKNYYNAHNNSMFSSYGNKAIGPQVCYKSGMVFNGRSSWDWVKNEYCSTQGEISAEYKWILHHEPNSDEFYISDFAGNLLKFSDVKGSPNRYFAYTASSFWYDDNEFLKRFIFNDYAKVYAMSFTTFRNYDENKRLKILQAFDAVKDYYLKYQIGTWKNWVNY